VDLSAPEVVMTIAFGLVVGMLSGMMGVGGGLLMIPFMVFVLDEPQTVAEGTSLLVIVPTAIAGVLAHRMEGLVALREVLFLGAGGVLGSFAGALIALSLHSDVLEGLFGGFAVIMGARLIWRGLAAR
jgi:uncharacterized protein